MAKATGRKRVGGAATFAQRRKQPPPDLKCAVQTALRVAADQLAEFTIIDIWGIEVDERTSEIFTEAQKVAVNYIRMGAQG